MSTRTIVAFLLQFVNGFVAMYRLERVANEFGQHILNEHRLKLQAWTGPEGSRKLRFPDFVTTAQDGGRL